MHFTQTFFLGASAFAAFVAAQSNTVLFTGTPNSVTAGSPSTISYQVNDKTVPVTIILRKGNPDDLQTIANLTTTSTGGQFVWTPSKSLADGSDYALQITQGSEINYSKEFALIGGAAAVSSSASSSSASSSASSTRHHSAAASVTGAPYPAGNATAPHATGTGAPSSSSPTGILPGGSSTLSPVVSMSSTGSAPAATTSKSGATALSGSLSLALAVVAVVACLQ